MKLSKNKHIEASKIKALEYVERGELNQAFLSMIDDLSKHPETKSHDNIDLGWVLFVLGDLETETEMKKFINGFN